MSHSGDQLSQAKSVLGHIHNVICRTYHIKETPIGYKDPEKVLTVFVRTNDGGVKLEKSDLLLSYMESNKDLFALNGARKEITAFIDELNKEEVDKPNYFFSKDDVLKASLFLCDLNIRYRLDNFTRENLKIISTAWPKIKLYLTLTARLLARYGFSSKNIVSKNVLITIAYFLQMNSYTNRFIESMETSDIEIKNSIVRWFSISTLSRLFGASSDTTLEKLRESLKANTSFTRIISGKVITRKMIEEWVDKENYNSTNSHLILMIITVNRYWDKCHQDHIYPQSKFKFDYLKNLGLDEKTIDDYRNKTNSLANLQLLNPSINIIKQDDDFIDWKDRQNEQYLEGMCIPTLDDYSFRNFIIFTERRRQQLIDKLCKLLGAVGQQIEPEEERSLVIVADVKLHP